jgi:hypothetical protein
LKGHEETGKKVKSDDVNIFDAILKLHEFINFIELSLSQVKLFALNTKKITWPFIPPDSYILEINVFGIDYLNDGGKE